VTLRPMQIAVPAKVQSSPNNRRNAALSLVVGLALGCAIVLGRARFDNQIRSAAAMSSLTTSPVLGSIRRSDRLKEHRLAIVQDPGSQVSEDLRQLRANLIEAGGGRRMCVMVASSVRSEGRTTVAANLAAALAEAGRSTVLIEGDLRQPQVEKFTGADSSYGLVEVVLGERSLDDALQRPDNLGFTVLASGGSHPNPSELLSSAAFTGMVKALRERFNYVIVDSPALLAVADATALHDSVDGALFVVDTKAVTSRQVQSAMDSANAAGLRIVGVVINGLSERDLPFGGRYSHDTDRAPGSANNRRIRSGDGSATGNELAADYGLAAYNGLAAGNELAADYGLAADNEPTTWQLYEYGR
jgi:capsular exopolysaccharide synthesis family protein